jgi:hypothetical protein
LLVEALVGSKRFVRPARDLTAMAISAEAGRESGGVAWQLDGTPLFARRTGGVLLLSAPPYTGFGSFR